MSHWLEAARRVAATGAGEEVDGVPLDALSAATLVSVHENLNAVNAARLASLPLANALDFVFNDFLPLLGDT